MEEDNIAFRLKFLIQKLGITSSEFADKCGISRATLSQLLTGRNRKISDVVIGQIHSAYPSVSIMWLLFNEGDMWVGQPEGKWFQDVHAAENEAQDHDEESHTNTSICTHDGLETENHQKNAHQISEFPPSYGTSNTEAKENGLNTISKCTLHTDNKQNNPLINNLELINEIENFRPKPRKIVQITIYYDDNTFESFFPDGKNK